MTQTVPDISPLIPMHQDPLLVCKMFIRKIKPKGPLIPLFAFPEMLMESGMESGTVGAGRLSLDGQERFPTWNSKKGLNEGSIHIRISNSTDIYCFLIQQLIKQTYHTWNSLVTRHQWMQVPGKFPAWSQYSRTISALFANARELLI